MLKLPSIRGEALAVLVGTSVLIFILTSFANGSGGPVPKTSSAALLVALFVFQWVFLCFGTLFSVKIRNWFFEPSPELEQAVPGFWICGVLSFGMVVNLLHRAWELFQQAPQ